jgi:hypothetical protein
MCTRRSRRIPARQPARRARVHDSRSHRNLRRKRGLRADNRRCIECHGDLRIVQRRCQCRLYMLGRIPGHHAALDGGLGLLRQSILRMASGNQSGNAGRAQLRVESDDLAQTVRSRRIGRVLRDRTTIGVVSLLFPTDLVFVFDLDSFICAVSSG